MKIQFLRREFLCLVRKCRFYEESWEIYFEGQAPLEVNLLGLPEGNKQIPRKGQARNIVAVIDGLRKGLLVACFLIQISIPE